MNDEHSLDDPDCLIPISLVSKCCGAPSMTELYETKFGNIIGRCSTCKEMTTFEPEIEND